VEFQAAENSRRELSHFGTRERSNVRASELDREEDASPANETTAVHVFPDAWAQPPEGLFISIAVTRRSKDSLKGAMNYA
jgi:hypothetical protein